MALNDILNSAVSGLSAAQAGLRSVSNNISNVGTVGYARERVSLTTSVTQGRVTGVTIGEAQRVADRFLEEAVYARSGDTGRAEVSAAYLDRLQSLLGEPGADSGLAARMDAINSAAIALTGARAADESLAVFTANVEDAIETLKQLDTDVATLRGEVESEVGYTVERVNSLLSRIYDLNSEVARLSGQGRSSVGAEGQRMNAIEELSGLVKINARAQTDGRINIETASGAMLIDTRLRQLSYPTVGQGVSQSTYPPIEIRFANGSGDPGAATGEKLDSSAVGGKLGGLIDLRDRALPEFSEQLGVLFGGLAGTINKVANAGTTYPAPNALEGRPTGLIGSDRLGFSGTAVFAVTDGAGQLVARADIDFTALGAGATVDDAVAAINAGLGGAATARFVDGALQISATDAGQGVVIAQGTPASSRAGVGFSQYFGLNDMIRSETGTLVPSGLVATDPHGFAPGETAELVLRASDGRILGSTTLTGSAGPTFGDLVTELNSSSLGSFGTFSLDDLGRVQFAPRASIAGASLSIPSDSTDRFGTGKSFSVLSGLTGHSQGLADAGVRTTVLANPSKLSLAKLQLDAAVGEAAIGSGDNRGSAELVEALSAAVNLGKDGITTLPRLSTKLLSSAGTQASRARDALNEASTRLEDAVNRRDSFSGVNLDEELAQMVVLQNSYSAAARVMTTANQMLEVLIGMVR